MDVHLMCLVCLLVKLCVLLWAEQHVRFALGMLGLAANMWIHVFFAAAFAGRSCMLGVGYMLVHVCAPPCKFVFGLHTLKLKSICMVFLLQIDAGGLMPI